MKFWRFYGERWVSKTSHLSMMQEGAYHRLCTWCMLHERPLPPNRIDVLRCARAATRSQEQATMTVLEQFFSLQPDGYHQKTADEILQWWHASGASSNAKCDDGTRARVAALRARKAVIVKALQGHGVRALHSMGMTELKALMENNHVTVSEDALRVTGNGSGYRNGNGVTINKELNSVTRCAHNVVTAPALGSDDPEDEDQTPDLDRPGPLTRALKAMEKAGLDGVYPTHPTLSWLIDAGLTPRDFYIGARDAVHRGKGYAWALAMMKGRIEDSRKAANGSGKPSNGHTSDFSAGLDGLVTPEGAERLRKRLLNPDLDPWELPPRSEVEGDSS